MSGWLLLICFCALSMYAIAQTDCDFCNAEAKGYEGLIMNLTVRSGDRAVLTCAVNNPRELNYAVVWQDRLKTTYFYNQERLIADKRFELQREGNEWNMLISHVSYPDRGIYKCVANTEPVQIKYIDLQVQVPPRIHRDMASRDIEVTEGANVYLLCNASGMPQPTIRWTRRPNDNTQQSAQYLPYVGTELLITNASKYCDDVYECIASNGVEPSDRHSMIVKVRFAPEVMLPTPRIMQLMGGQTILNCHVRFYPTYMAYWAKDDIEIRRDFPPARYSYTFERIGSFTLQVMLHISDLQKQDYGMYKCVAVNSVGRTEKRAELAELTPPKANTHRPHPVNTASHHIRTAVRLEDIKEKPIEPIISGHRPLLITQNNDAAGMERTRDETVGHPANTGRISSKNGRDDRRDGTLNEPAKRAQAVTAVRSSSGTTTVTSLRTVMDMILMATALSVSVLIAVNSVP